MLGAPRTPRPSRLEKRRDVTIIAGFPQTGFVALAVDGEEGGYYDKATVRKIATIRTDSYVCLIGGAGDGDFIDLAVQTATEELADFTIPITLQVLRLALESVVTDIYNERIDALPIAERDGRAFDLLCAIWTKESGKAQLVKVSRALSLIRSKPEVIGKGSPLARYLIDTFQNESMATRQVERLAAYVLAQVKAHVKDCGGASQIIFMSDTGVIQEVPQYIITEDEAELAIVMGGGVRWLFHWVDFIGWQGNDAKVNEVIDQVTHMIKEDMGRYIARRRAELAVGAPVAPPTQSDPT